MEPADKRRKIDAGEIERARSLMKQVGDSDGRDKNPNILLHVAVEQNTLDMLSFLLTSGYDVNARDSSGLTPLLLAAYHNNFEAVQLLLDADADVCDSDATGRSSFEILVGNRIVSEDVIRKCLERFCVSRVDPATKARILLATHCSLRLVVSLRDAAVTQTFLDLTTAIDNPEAVDIMRAAMKDLDVENVRALLHHGPGTDQRRTFFLYFLVEVTRGAHPNLTLFETFIRELVDLDVLGNENVRYLRGITMGGREEAVRMLLQYDIDVYVRESFGYHLLPYVFRNTHFDAIKMLKDRHFDLNGRTPFGTAIQSALYCNSVKRIQYLLDVGADPNAESRHGSSSIVDCQAWGKKCLGKMLLQHGADVQAINEFGRSVFNVANYKPIVSCILPQLAIVEAQGTQILQQIRERIDRKKMFKDAYALYCKQVDGFKKYKLSRSVTLFTVLTEKTEVVAGLLRDEDKVSLVEKYCREKKVHPYYKSTLKLMLQRAMNFYRAKCNVTMLVSKGSGREVASDHLVVEKIFSLLRYYEMVKLASV